MPNVRLVPVLLLVALGATSSPGLGQAIPDNIPDEPGESLVDREKKRLEERFRGTLSRFFSGGGFDVAPLAAEGLGYQANVNVGMYLPGGDALLLAVAARDVPARLGSEIPDPGRRWTEWYYSVGYELSATRLLGPTPFAQRSAIGLGVGVLSGEVSVLALDLGPTYDVIQRDSWSVPVGVRLNVAMVGSRDIAVTRAFLGVSLGVRWHWARRDKLE